MASLIQRARFAATLFEEIVFGGLGTKQQMTVPLPSGATSLPVAGWNEGIEDRFSQNQLLSLYRLSTWVYAGVQVIANAQMVAELTVKRELADGTMELQPGHPFTRLMLRPNPWMSGAEVAFRRAADLELAGDAYQLLFFEDGLLEPVALMPVPPQIVKPIVDSRKFISGYEIDPGRGRPFTVPTEAMIHFRNYDPINLTTGMASVRAIVTSAIADREAERYSALFNKQAIRPPSAFSTTEELVPEEAAELKKELIAMYGGPEHAGEPLLLWSGLAPVKMAFTPQESDTLDMRHLSRDMILGGLGVSKSLLGLTDDVNRATAEAMEYGLARRVTHPKLVRVQQTYTGQVLIPFYGEDLHAAYDDVVPADEDRMIKKVVALQGAEAITKNEMRSALVPDLGDLEEGGDELAGSGGGGEAQLFGGGITRRRGSSPEDEPENPLLDAQRNLALLGTKLDPQVRSMLDAGASLEEVALAMDARDDIEQVLAEVFRQQGARLTEQFRESGGA